jgi:hypothetical protein
MQESGLRAARFHLKDGRPLVFHSIPESLFRRRAGEILLFLTLLAVGMLAATLLAKSRADPPRQAVNPPRTVPAARR